MALFFLEADIIFFISLMLPVYHSRQCGINPRGMYHSLGCTLKSIEQPPLCNIERVRLVSEKHVIQYKCMTKLYQIISIKYTPVIKIFAFKLPHILLKQRRPGGICIDSFVFKESAELI